jgi:hypothetical protein
MASTVTIQDVVNSMRVYPELQPTFSGVSGYTQEPALTIANDLLQKFLAQPLDWKFNRANISAILTVPLQQDYVTSVTNLSWLEQAWRLDINNSSVPKPFFGMEAVRDISQSSRQVKPFNVSWVPNSLAIMGRWKANTLYPCSYGSGQSQSSPIQQFLDANGNILYINSTSLNLSLDSPGLGASDFVEPTTPYGTSGAVQPVLPASSAAGTTVVDGTVTWTVANPEGITIRLAGVPPTSGIPWLITPVYQKKPPILTSLQNTFSPVPDEYRYLINQGFRAMTYQHAGLKTATEMYAQWEEALVTALRSADREREDASLYPNQSLTGSSPYNFGMHPGPSWPFDWQGGY